MAIPEAQLDTWSAIGQTQQFTNTYDIIKRALEDTNAPYAVRNFEIFLQGSYRNNTNVHGDSDVDVVICLTSSFRYDLGMLTETEKANFQAAFPTNAAYTLSDFKREVIAWLEHKFGAENVVPGNKAIKLRETQNRRSADILVCSEYHEYVHFTAANQQKIVGIQFDTPTGSVINFPRMHRENCSTKHQDTANLFKPTVRIFKNARNRLIRDRKLQGGIAPSYFIEGLLHNVPNDRFTNNRTNTVLSCYRWLWQNDQQNFWCANGVRLLIRDGRSDAWPTVNYKAFMEAFADQWDNWR